MLKTPLLFILVISVALLGGCASTPTASPAQPSPALSQAPSGVSTDTPTAQSLTPGANAGASDDYRIGPQDLLEIQVFGVSELTRTVRVNSRGLISLPLVGQVKAAGLTSEELEANLARQLASTYLQDPQVTLFIKEYTSQRVTVEGAVKRPGLYPIKGRTTLMQAIALAEGLGEYADADQVTLFRAQPSGTKVAMLFDLNTIRNGTAIDPPIQNDDVVSVPTDNTKVTIKGVTDTLRGFIIPFALFP